MQFYQACYAHPDAGWREVNCSNAIPQDVLSDFLSAEKGNASAAIGQPVPQGTSLSPSCMTEVYCKNNHFALVQVRYNLSDQSGRPVSFAHGYIFPDAYEKLKNPENLLSISEANYVDSRISSDETTKLAGVSGALNVLYIEKTRDIPEQLNTEGTYSVENALAELNMNEETYKAYVEVVVSQCLSSNTEKSVFVKTDGSRQQAMMLLYLLYRAIPYSMRLNVSAATYARTGQHNARVIFCAELPKNSPYIIPFTGENNVLNQVALTRFVERNPFVVYSAVSPNPQVFFDNIETILDVTGNKMKSSMSLFNLAYMICTNGLKKPDQLPVILYNWLVLPIENNDKWEKYAVNLMLKNAIEMNVSVNSDARKMLIQRMRTAKTEDFSKAVCEYFVSEMSGMNEQEAIRYLNSLELKTEDFIYMRRSVFEMDGGKGARILDGICEMEKDADVGEVKYEEMHHIRYTLIPRMAAEMPTKAQLFSKLQDLFDKMVDKGRVYPVPEEVEHQPDDSKEIASGISDLVNAGKHSDSPTVAEVLLRFLMREGGTIESETIEKLKSWSVSNLNLHNTLEKYQKSNILLMDKKDAYAYLDKSLENDTNHNQIRSILLRNENGKKLLSEYYLQHVDKVIGGRAGFGDIAKEAERCAGCSTYPTIRTKLLKALMKITEDCLDGREYYDVVINSCNACLSALGEQELSKIQLEQFEGVFVNNFVKQFNPKNLDEYEAFYRVHEKGWGNSAQLCKCLSNIRQKDWPAVTKYIKSLNDMIRKDKSAEQCIEYLEIIEGYVYECDSERQLVPLELFNELLEPGSVKEFFNDLIEGNAEVIRDPELFRKSLESDPYWVKNDARIVLLGILNDDIRLHRIKDEDLDVYKKIIEILRDKRSTGREEKVSGKGLFGLFGKK